MGVGVTLRAFSQRKKKPETTSVVAWSFSVLGDWSDWSGADTSHSSNQKRNDFEVSVLSASDAEHVRRLARQLASPRDVFVIVETCDGTKGRVELENALERAARDGHRRVAYPLSRVDARVGIERDD